MAWNNAVVTNKGITMLREVLAGGQLTIDRGAGGTGTIDPSALMAQTSLKNQKQAFPIVDSVNVANGKKLNVQITSQGSTGYAMQQLGVWAHVGTSESELFAILQDAKGIDIPSWEELPDFALNFFAVIDFSNQASFSVTVDPSALVSYATFTIAMNGLHTQLGNLVTVATHTKAGTVHSLTLDKTATAGIQMVQFTATVDYAEGDTWLVDGVTYSAKLQGEDGTVPDKLFVVGDMVSVMLDPVGNKLGFKSGGGGTELNVFCQLTEPTAPDGVWVKMADKPTYVAVKTYDDITVSGSWSIKPSMPTARAGLAGSAVGTIIYCTGGITDRVGRRNTNEAYDTISDTWSTKAPMPTARDVLTGSAIGTIVYCVGGVNLSSKLIGTNEAYDTISNTWSTKAPMPTARISLAGSSIGTIAYFAGGNNNGSLKVNEAYDAISDTWSTKAPMPTARHDLVVGAIGIILYCVGGDAKDGVVLKVNEAYDTISNTWSTKAPMPTARADLGTSAIGTIMYCAGGRKLGGEQPGALDTNEAYDAISDTWATKPYMPTALRDMACARVNTTVYAIGGLDISNARVGVNVSYDAAGTILPDSTLAIPNYGTQGKKTKLISDKKSELYTYINQPVYYTGGQQTYPESYTNYDDTGWKLIN